MTDWKVSRRRQAQDDEHTLMWKNENLTTSDADARIAQLSDVECDRIEQVWLSFNELDEFPLALQRLRRLQYLWLSDNCIRVVPAKLQFPNLKG